MTKNAAIITLNNEGYTLLMKLNYGEFKWVTPGGNIDPGEESFTAAVREFREEVGDDLDMNMVEDIDTFFTGKTKIFVIRTNQFFNINLSHEHKYYTFIQLDDLFDYFYKDLASYAKKTFNLAYKLGLLY